MTEEQKCKLVEIDRQESRRGKNFMKRMKARCDTEYPTSRRTTQNLIDNARKFKKERSGRRAEPENRDETEVQQWESIGWTTEMKIVLVMLDKDERAKGRRFMKRDKDRWDMKYPEHESASCQKLKSNAARFKKDSETKNLILVRRKEEVQVVEVGTENNPEKEGNIVEPFVDNDEEEQITGDGEVLENVLIRNNEELSEK